MIARAFGIAQISYGNQGIMGGPSNLDAPQVATEQASVGIGLQTDLPAPEVAEISDTISPAELSTASLDGGKIVEKSKVSALDTAAEKAVSEPDKPSSAAKNQSTLDSATPLPDASKEQPAPKAVSKPKTPVKSSRYFIQPTSGHNWGILHNHNAVDIANSCGTPVVAAAAGTVVSDPGLGNGHGGWNGGYGNFILVQHGNGTKTRYAHLSRIEVAIGEHVEQGEEIGKIGNTGEVTGATGCHLHFEVLGGTNPFAK